MTEESKPIKTGDFKQYLNESRGLERDYISELLASRKRAWFVAIGLGFLATLALAAGIAGLKRDPFPPIILRVDNATGAVDIVTTMRESEKSYGEIVDIYWLNLYVLNRESYDYNSIQMLYETTALLSTPEVQKEYYSIYEGENARDKVLHDQSRIIVTVRSITPNNHGGKATIRFTTQEKNSNGQLSPLKNLIATVTYRYVDVPMRAEDRRINPLGFQVTSYRADPETISN